MGLKRSKMSDIVKQVIIVRSDLNIRKGKIASQCAHASMKVFFDRIDFGYSPNKLVIVPITLAMHEWVRGLFTKVVLSIDSEENLLILYNSARELGLPCALITDAGKTEFNGVPTNTCIAVGPARSSEIDVITGPDTELYKSGKLKLL